METIELSKKIKIKDKETDKIELDFDKVTGNMLLNSEKETRARGEQTPTVMFAQMYQVSIAAKMTGISYNEICAMPGKDFQKIVMAVSRFLFQ